MTSLGISFLKYVAYQMLWNWSNTCKVLEQGLGHNTCSINAGYFIGGGGGFKNNKYRYYLWAPALVVYTLSDLDLALRHSPARSVMMSQPHRWDTAQRSWVTYLTVGAGMCLRTTWHHLPGVVSPPTFSQPLSLNLERHLFGTQQVQALQRSFPSLLLQPSPFANTLSVHVNETR